MRPASAIVSAWMGVPPRSQLISGAAVLEAVQKCRLGSIVERGGIHGHLTAALPTAVLLPVG
jgi:hypothetical protein